ncbi:MAG: TonB-dependent hemoglobin/transferrin/lactoferrin family receptor [Pseudomonadota bacterium]
MYRITATLAAVFAAFTLAEPVLAQGASDDEATPRDEITVIGTRTERRITEVPVTVSVLTAEELDQQLTRDISDLVRYEPGVSVGGTGSRFGLSGFSIRGIGGNRVLTVVDGIRVAEEFSFGPFLSARRDFVDIDSLEAVEIARGPISSLYGSDALGGVVSFTTRGPLDYLADDDDGLHLDGKAGWSSADASTVARGTIAVGDERLSAMLAVTQRDGEETETIGGIGGFGPTREQPDLQDLSSTNVLAKVRWEFADSHVLTATIDTLTSEADTQILSDYDTPVISGFSGVVTAIVNTRDAVDERERTRISLAYSGEFDTPIFDALSLTAYTQDSETTQDTFENRTVLTGTAPADINRERLSVYEQQIDGVFAQALKTVEWGSTVHNITYGFDYFETENSSIRNGGSFELDGTPVFEFLPLPTRDFPLTTVEQTAFFLQDEISFLDGKLLLSPGLRYDRFDASTTADEVFLNGNPGAPIPADYDADEVTARLGAVYSLNDDWSVYGLYAEGFRAPPYDDVNVGFTNFIGGYKTIASPDLESERSEGIELGVRYQSDNSAVSVNVFQTNYDDFIASFAIAPQFLATGGIDPADGLLTFQSINLDEVTIEGAELSAEVGLGNWGGLGDFSLRSAIAYAEGEDNDGAPIDSVEPLTGVFGLLYSSNDGNWGGELVWTVVEAKDEADIFDPDTRQPSDGYGVVDLLLYGSLTERVRFNVGLFNVGDKEFIRWVDTQGVGNDAVRRFTQPGFNAAVNLSVEF